MEDKEIIISEKIEVGEITHAIKGDTYSVTKNEKTLFKSSIFSYADISVLVSKEKRFNDYYYKIVLFSDKESKAWELIAVLSRLEIKLKRLKKDVFFVSGIGSTLNDTSQVSFCKIKPSTKVDEITMNFNKLDGIDYILDKGILLAYAEVADRRGEEKLFKLLSLYNNEGKLVKNFYEYFEDDPVVFTHSLEGTVLTLVKQEGGKKGQARIDLKELF